MQREAVPAPARRGSAATPGPTMTVGYLLFAAFNLTYILIGITLEERDLVAVSGDEYRRDKQRVAMLIPWR
jgi:protein-S-isoprenylcysteine O-methyltransferase Ste14